jgi:hypothetical protein
MGANKGFEIRGYNDQSGGLAVANMAPLNIGLAEIVAFEQQGFP